MMYKKEFSKLILHQTMLIFISQLIASLVFAWCGKDTSIFVYTIPSTAGIFGAAIVFYLNKAKMENVCKGKIQFFKFKMKWIEKHPDHQNQIENEFSNIESVLTNKIDSEIESAVSEEITLQNY